MEKKTPVIPPENLLEYIGDYIANVPMSDIDWGQFYPTCSDHRTVDGIVHVLDLLEEDVVMYWTYVAPASLHSLPASFETDLERLADVIESETATRTTAFDLAVWKRITDEDADEIIEEHPFVSSAIFYRLRFPGFRSSVEEVARDEGLHPVDVVCSIARVLHAADARIENGNFWGLDEDRDDIS
jgi:hypothetical protein